MVKKTTIGLLMLFVFAWVSAQSSQTPPSQTPPSQTPPSQTTPPAQTAPAQEVQAAENLIQMMDMKTTFDEGREAMLKAQMQANPNLAPFEDLMRQFLEKYLTWDRVKGDFVQIYTDLFTEPELRELIQLYKTPTGKKLMTSMPEIMNRSMQVTQNQLQPHLPELQEQIRARVQERQRQQQQQQPQPSPEQGQPQPAQPSPEPSPSQPQNPPQ